MPGVGSADLLVKLVDNDVTGWDLAALLPLLPAAVKAGSKSIYISGKGGTGFAWHHHQDGTTMQLVDRLIHSKTGHSGGRQVTGGRP